MWLITRETVHFIALRWAYFLSPHNATRMSSRTVLFMSIPKADLTHGRLHEIFGPFVRRVWMATDCKSLQKLVDDRNETTNKLETAEIKLSQTANKRRLKAAKDNKPVEKEGGGHSASSWLAEKDRPTHRLKFFGLLGKKVDTINWSRDHLREITPKIEAQQKAHRNAEAPTITAAVVEFSTQRAAQAAYQSRYKSRQMTPRQNSIVPDDIIWKNIGMSWTSRWLRNIVTTTFIALMIIFWAIPVAIVGAISNIQYLTGKVHFLSFINSIPPVILGVVTGLLPSVLLAVLMALVPIICRRMLPCLTFEVKFLADAP